MGVRVNEEWFSICGGCEVTILDIGEPLLDILAKDRHCSYARSYGPQALWSNW